MSQELHATRGRSDHMVGHPWMLVISLALLGVFVVATVIVANAMKMENNWVVLVMLVFDILSFAFVIVSFHRPSQSRSSEGQKLKTEREALQDRRAFWSDMFPGAVIAPFLTMLISVFLLKVMPDWIVGMVTIILVAFGFLALVLWRHRVAKNALRRLK